MKVVYSYRALRDIDELLRYVAAQDAGTADAMSAAIGRAVGRLKIDPKLGLTCDDTNLRRLPLRRHKLAIFYRHFPLRKEVRVVRIVRGRRVRRLEKVPT